MAGPDGSWCDTFVRASAPRVRDGGVFWLFGAGYALDDVGEDLLSLAGVQR